MKELADGQIRSFHIHEFSWPIKNMAWHIFTEYIIEYSGSSSFLVTQLVLYFWHVLSTRLETIMIFGRRQKICMKNLKPYKNNNLNLHLKDTIYILFLICLVKLNPFDIKCSNKNILKVQRSLEFRLYLVNCTIFHLLMVRTNNVLITKALSS